MPFRKHLFISYTHDDNKPLAGEEQGWVSLLHQDLETLLPIRLGLEPVIWRDNKLHGNDEFSNEISDQLAEVATIVCILSRKYLNSDWCRREARTFCGAVCKTGLKIGNKTRVFKVMKFPVGDQPEGFPEEFGKLTGYDFYITKDGRNLELDPAFGPQMRSEFHVRTAALADDLADTLLALNQSGEAPAATKSNIGTVFLAATSWDRDLDRKLVEKELTGRGYTVVPDADLPQNEKACDEAIGKMLAASEFSIHLIGNDPAITPSGPRQKSVDVVQYELARQERQQRGIPLFVWMPDENQSKNAAHQSFLESLECDDNAQHRAEVVKGSMEDFKSAVLQALEKLQQKKNAPPAQADETGADRDKRIYVLCDKRDNKATVDLRKALQATGYQPFRPLFDGDAGTVRQQNNATLANCGTVVLFWGAPDKGWYDAMLTEVQKAGSGARIWTYLAPPVSSDKQLLLDEQEGGPIIDAMGGAVPQAELERMLGDRPKGAAAGGQLQ